VVIHFRLFSEASFRKESGSVLLESGKGKLGGKGDLLTLSEKAHI